MRSFSPFQQSPAFRDEENAAVGLPPLFGVALGLAIILPLLNFLRARPLGDFFGEWSCAVALSLATFAIAQRLPRRAALNWSTVALPGLIASVVLIQVGLGKYSYAADWVFCLAYLGVASLAALLGQAMSGMEMRREVVVRIAWALVLTSSINFLLQAAQASRLDVEWRPFVVYRPEEYVCQLFGNVGQNNHANTLAWLGIGSVVYLLSGSRIGARTAAVLLSVLLLSSALTAARMAWLYLAVTVGLLAFRPICPTLSGRSRLILAATLVTGFAFANWGSEAIRANISASCVSGVDRLLDGNEGGYAVRFLLWKQAVEVWQAAPWMGVGSGGFIGSVYEMDLGEGRQPLDAWVHNAALQVLAEFGLIVIVGVCLIFLAWIAKIVRRREELTAEDGLLVTGLSILGIHSMLEFPLWYLHFLVLGSLFIGLLIRPDWAALRLQFPARMCMYAFATAIAIGSVAIVSDYRKLDRLHWISDFIQGVGAERIPDAQQTLEEAAIQVRFFDHMRDYLLAIGRPPTKEDLDGKILIVDRAMGRMPNVNIIHVRILLAILADDPQTARIHLRRMFKFHPNSAVTVTERLRARIKAQPDEFSVLDSMLDEELARRPPKRW